MENAVIEGKQGESLDMDVQEEQPVEEELETMEQIVENSEEE